MLLVVPSAVEASVVASLVMNVSSRFIEGDSTRYLFVLN